MFNIKPVFAYAKNDLVSGLVVFLIALPLCLGIAQASNAPLLSGIVSGVVGGIIIGILSKSQLSVSGPAAGLVAIVIGAIESLGAFEIFLCAVILAGLFQFLLGVIKAGSIASFIPLNVIEGMLAGIGITIIIKQIPDAFGLNPVEEKGLSLTALQHTFQNLETGAVIIALIGLAILATWQMKGMKRWNIIPAGLLVVVTGAILNKVFAHYIPAWHLTAAHLVSLPLPRDAAAFFAQFKNPDFSGFLNPLVWQTALVIAAVASIESLLSIEATDKLDPEKRTTPGDAELKAQGIGNFISGFLGGLPVTTVIVRSSANINAGAKSKLSTVIHGTLLLVCVAAIPSVLNLIPKATLAAILIFTGYRLCRPSVVRHVWKAGMAQFLPFLITALAVVFLDLLQGVGLGIAISIFYILRNNIRIPFYFQRSVYKNGEVIRLNLAQEVSFLNKASIKAVLDRIAPKSIVILDASETEYIDYDVLEIIKDFRRFKAPLKQIRISLIGFKNSYKIPDETEAHGLDNPVFNMEQELVKRSAGKSKKLIQQLSAQS